MRTSRRRVAKHLRRNQACQYVNRIFGRGRGRTVKISFWGSSLVSAYWNGAATYYRGILRALAQQGHEITFFEPDAYDRQRHRDIDDPEWARIVVYDAHNADEVSRHLAWSERGDVVVKASGVGVLDEFLEA